jgi:ketosteroid isomerase-like protein
MTQNKFTFFLLALVFGSHVSAQSNLSVDENSLTYLKKFRSEYCKNVVGKKPELLKAYYGENIRLMPEFQKTIRGQKNALLYHYAFSNRFDVLECSRVENEMLNLGSRIVELGVFSMKLKLKNTTKEHEVRGKYVNVWVKAENAKLLLVTEAWNYNQKLEIEDQLRFTEIPVFDVALATHLPIKSPISFELAALNLLMEATVAQHDAKIWSQFYTEDGMFLYSRNPMYKGRKELDEFLENHCKELPIFENLDIRNDEIIDLENYVIEYASHIASWRGGDYSGVGLGKDLRIWRREKDCSLKIFRHIGMYD